PIAHRISGSATGAWVSPAWNHARTKRAALAKSSWQQTTKKAGHLAASGLTNTGSYPAIDAPGRSGHRDLAGLHGLVLRQRDIQHAVAQFRGNLVRVDGVVVREQ